MYVLLHGAKKNVGDFFIFDRAKSLLEAYLNDKEFLILPRWEGLDENIDKINQSKAIIICGGPGYSSNFYPEVYPLTQDLNKIKIPIIPMGLGWVGRPIAEPGKFRFSDLSLEVIKSIHSKIEYSSVRDNLTLELLNRNGLDNVLMTGCPTWYHLESIDIPFKAPRAVDKITVSMAQNKIYFDQNLSLLEELKKTFPGAQLIAVFHRGLEADQYTKGTDAKALQELASGAREFGCEIVNAGYDLEKMGVYKDSDLHVGYRVHAHIYNLSHRNPSFLIWEDGRGRGVSETLGLENDLPAMNIRKLKTYRTDILAPSKLHKALDKLNGNFFLGKDVPVNMVKNITDQIKEEFKSFEGLELKFKKHLKIMEKFINSIPS